MISGGVFLINICRTIGILFWLYTILGAFVLLKYIREKDNIELSALWFDFVDFPLYFMQKIGVCNHVINVFVYVSIFIRTYIQRQ